MQKYLNWISHRPPDTCALAQIRLHTSKLTASDCYRIVETVTTSFVDLESHYGRDAF
jgi:hypothetical protein